MVVNMAYERHLDEFKKIAGELSSIGNVDAYRQTSEENNRKFLYNWRYEVALFNKLSDAFKNDLDKLLEIMNVFNDIGFNNPSLEKYVEKEMDNYEKRIYNHTTGVSNKSFDASALQGRIESYIAEVNSLYYADLENLEQLAWEMDRVKQELLANKNRFDINVFNSLLNDLNDSISKVDFKINSLNEIGKGL